MCEEERINAILGRLDEIEEWVGVIASELALALGRSIPKPTRADDEAENG